MSLKLKPSRGWPTGGYPFADPKTGKVFDGMSADLRLQATNVIQHRLANPRIYPSNELGWFDQAGVENEITNQICGKSPELCWDETQGVQPTTPIQRAAGKGCIKCGGNDFSPVYCPTCSGQKLLAWKCNACGTENPK